MGSLLNRSSAQEDVKVRKVKRKRKHEKLQMSSELDLYLIHDGQENENPNGDFIQKNELRNQKFGRKNMMNMNDPPGAPSTYSPDYSDPHKDINTQSWSSHDANNSFHPINSHQMTSYNLNQYNYNQTRNRINNQSNTVVPEEQPSKKGQFFSSQETSAFKPLTNTQSLHDLADTSVPTTKSMLLTKRSSVPQSIPDILKTSSTQVPVGKPIYVGIDHRATLAERGQTVAHKRHRKSGERYLSSDELNSSTNNQRPRSHTHNSQKHQTATESPTFNTDSRVKIPKSLSTNKLTHNIQEISFISKETKPLKSKSDRRRQSAVNNEIKPSTNREIHRRHHQQQQHSIPPNESALKAQSSSQRIDGNHPGTPVMRIHLPPFTHQHQKHPIVRSMGANTNSTVIRTRV